MKNAGGVCSCRRGIVRAGGPGDHYRDVTNQTGALVPGVKISARHVQTGITGETRSNTEGHYTIPYLSPGQYDVTAESDGFKKARVTGVNLTVGLIATVDFALEVGAVQNEVTVVASAVQLEQQSSALGRGSGEQPDAGTAAAGA